MADPTFDQVGQWIIDNQDKAGTPDFVTMSDAYRQMKAGQPQGEQAPGDRPRVVIDTSPKTNGEIPDINDVLRQRNAANPYGWDNTINRMVTGAVTAIPDTVIALGNAATRLAGDGGGWGMAGVQPGASKEAPYLGPKMLAAGGGVPLPEDAPWYRQLAEGGGSALLGGGAGAIKSAVTHAPSWISSIVPAAKTFFKSTVAPTVGSNVGGQVGGAFGETGALLGSLAGGFVPHAGSAGKSYVDARYRGQGKPEAPQIAAAAERQGIPTTAGMLGNTDVQAQERQLSGKPGALNFIQGRREASTNAVEDAMNRIATARGSTDLQPSPASIGQNVRTVADEASQGLKARLEAEQQHLENRVGFDTQVPVESIIAHGYAQMPGQSVPGREALTFRLQQHLDPLINRAADGRPILDANGQRTVPYGLLRQFRTDLGRSFEQGKYPAATQQLYEPTTLAMRDAAMRRGVSPLEFDNSQMRYRIGMGSEPPPGAPNVPELQKVAGKEENPAYSFLHGGANNPSRLQMLDATGHPQMPATFGDYLRMMSNQTIAKGDSRSPVQLADRLSAPKMDPAALDIIGGPHANDLRDIASVARSINYPTNASGLTRSTGPQGAGLVKTLIGSDIFGKIGEHLGVGNITGRIVGLGATPLWHNMQARILQSEAARNALAGRPQAPGAQVSVNDLRAALTAANAGRQAGQ